MDTTSLIIIGVLVIVAIISLVFGILSFIKYSKTRKNLYLFLGILLTFIVPGILLYLAFKVYISSTSVVYMPFPNNVPNTSIEYMPAPDNGMVYMPGPA